MRTHQPTKWGFLQKTIGLPYLSPPQKSRPITHPNPSSIAATKGSLSLSSLYPFPFSISDTPPPATPPNPGGDSPQPAFNDPNPSSFITPNPDDIPQPRRLPPKPASNDLNPSSFITPNPDPPPPTPTTSRHRPHDAILSHFPNIASECLRYGLDITRDPIPVVPAAHYMCAGVRAGLHGETNVSGLFVAGEVACTGLHGANRLASNSLLEALVFAQRAVEPSINYATESTGPKSRIWAHPVLPISLKEDKFEEIKQKTKEVRRELQSVMWEFVGIVRSTQRLKTAEWRISELEAEWEDFLFRRGWKQTMVGVEACEMRNLFCCAKVLISSALARQESRGLHYTEDFPYLEESKRKPTVIFLASLPSAKATWSSQQVHKQLYC